MGSVSCHLSHLASYLAPLPRTPRGLFSLPQVCQARSCLRAFAHAASSYWNPQIFLWWAPSHPLGLSSDVTSSGGGPSVITPSKRALHPPSLCTVSIPLGFCHSRFLVSVLIVKHQERRSLFGSFMAVEQGLVHSRGSVGNLCLSLLMGHLRPLVLPLFRSIFHTTVGLSF